jgi:hypothetical protein
MEERLNILEKSYAECLDMVGKLIQLSTNLHDRYVSCRNICEKLLEERTEERTEERQRRAEAIVRLRWIKENFGTLYPHEIVWALQHYLGDTEGTDGRTSDGTGQGNSGGEYSS